MQDHLYRLGRRFSNLPALGEQVGAPVLQFTLFYRAHQQTLTSKHFTYCCHIIILQKAHTTIIHFIIKGKRRHLMGTRMRAGTQGGHVCRCHAHIFAPSIGASGTSTN